MLSDIMSSSPTLSKGSQQYYKNTLYLQGLKPAPSLPFFHHSWEYLKMLLDSSTASFSLRCSLKGVLLSLVNAQKLSSCLLTCCFAPGNKTGLLPKLILNCYSDAKMLRFQSLAFFLKKKKIKNHIQK